MAEHNGGNMKASKLVLAVLVAFLVLGCAQHAQQTKPTKKESLTIFCAGSLTIPLTDVNHAFKKYMAQKGVEVSIKLEPSGSVMAVRKVIDLHRKADVLAVADYTLIPTLMYPEYAKFYIAFARNELVLCYTNKSKYANEINANNWYEILAKKGVKFGFSNPNYDPCGYRSVMAMKLADLYYKKPIFENLVEKNTNITCNGNKIIVPINVRSDSKVVIRPKEVDLVSLLESGSIDYAFEYKSIALQHKLRYVELPSEINLGNFSLKDYYGQVCVTVWKMEKGKLVEKIIKGKPIVYGVTIPTTAQNKQLAIEYLSFLLSNKGRDIFKNDYQSFLRTPLGFGNVPSQLKSYVKIV